MRALNYPRTSFSAPEEFRVTVASSESPGHSCPSNPNTSNGGGKTQGKLQALITDVKVVLTGRQLQGCHFD